MPNSSKEQSQSPTSDYLKKVQDHINRLEQKLAAKDAEIERLNGLLEMGFSLKHDQEFGLAYPN